MNNISIKNETTMNNKNANVASVDPYEDLGINTRFPKFLIVLFFTELWERFSYYGMRALLTLYLVNELGFSDKKSISIYSTFAAIGYASPILGGYIADRLMGFKNMVFIGGITITLGHLLMSFTLINPDLIFVGLGLIAVGTGLFKGNVTNLLGICYANDEHSSNQDRGFTLFYVGVNLGAFAASISCAYVAHNFGWHYGFGLAGIGMFIGLVVFSCNQKLFFNKGDSPIVNLHKKRFFGLSPFALIMIGCFILSGAAAWALPLSDGQTNITELSIIFIISVMGYILYNSPSDQRRNFITLGILIIFQLLFFALEMQLGSLIALFTSRNVEDVVFGLYIPAAASQAINPLSIVLLGYIISLVNIPPRFMLARFAFGLLTMALAFGTFWFGCENAASSGKVEYIYLVLGSAFIGLGEVCIAPFVQSQVTLLAPKNMRGFIMGILFLSMAIANLMGIWLAEFISVPSMEGIVDPLVSLQVYKDGFWSIAKFNTLLALMFLLFCPFLQKIITKMNK
ncbi:MAG: oligopeptide:H+ symporter [Rickettsiaceae bacterium]|nr:oligopeptide:H+ symporter [Rickettsiaceae bacterium]